MVNCWVAVAPPGPVAVTVCGPGADTTKAPVYVVDEPLSTVNWIGPGPVMATVCGPTYWLFTGVPRTVMVGAPESAGVAGAAKSWPFLLDTETLFASSTTCTKYCSMVVRGLMLLVPVNVWPPSVDMS